MLPNSAMFAMSMSAYAFGPKYAYLADNQTYVVVSTFVSIWIALGTNIVGMRIGKWTENLGGITAWMLGFLLVGAGAAVWMRRGSATPMSTPMNFALPWNWETLGFFGTMAFAPQRHGSDRPDGRGNPPASPHRGPRHLDRDHF